MRRPLKGTCLCGLECGAICNGRFGVICCGLGYDAIYKGRGSLWPGLRRHLRMQVGSWPVLQRHPQWTSKCLGWTAAPA
jgi:hypothetical protein